MAGPAIRCSGTASPSTFFESVPDPVVAVARDGTIVLVNRHAERVFGYERDELLGEPIEMLFPARFRSDLIAQHLAYFEEPSTRALGSVPEFHGLRSDGSEFPLDIAVSPVGTSESATAIVVVHDLSEAKEFERRRDEELARANREARIAQSQRWRPRPARRRRRARLQQPAHRDPQLRRVRRGELSRGTTTRADVRTRSARPADRAAGLTRQLLAFSRRQVIAADGARPQRGGDATSSSCCAALIGEDVELVTSWPPSLAAVLADPGRSSRC